MSLEAWALPRISRLVPLDDDSIHQLLNYTLTLDKEGSASHLKNFLGDSAAALEFISSFNARRPATEQGKGERAAAEGGYNAPLGQDEEDGVPRKSKVKGRKKPTPYNQLPEVRRPV